MKKPFTPTSRRDVPSARDRLFDDCLRAGPPAVKVPDAFAQRVENAWRRAAREEAGADAEAPIAVRWRALVQAWVGPAVALGVLAFAVTWVLRGPSPAVELGGTGSLAGAGGAEIVGPGRSDETPVPTPGEAGAGPFASALRGSLGGASVQLAALEEDLASPYRAEAALMADDTVRALRFVAASVLTPEQLAALEAQGLLPGTPSRS